MADRRRYDSAMFWLAFGTAAAVVGIALMTIGVARSAPGGNLVASLWFDGGLVLLAAGGLLLLWALVLYLARRRGETHSTESSPSGAGTTMTLNTSLFNLGAAGGGAIGGALIAFSGYEALALGLPLFALAAALLSWRPSRAAPR